MYELNIICGIIVAFATLPAMFFLLMSLSALNDCEYLSEEGHKYRTALWTALVVFATPVNLVFFFLGKYLWVTASAIIDVFAVFALCFVAYQTSKSRQKYNTKKP